MKDKDFKRWLKRKIKVTLGVMISFLILGKLGYADNSTEELNNAKEQLKKAKEEHSAAKSECEEAIKKLNELLSQFKTNKTFQTNKVEAKGFDSYAVGGQADGHMSVVYGNGSKIIKENNELFLGGVGASIFGPYNLIKIEDLKDTYKNTFSAVGVANSIVGIANITENSNGSLIFGAGNKITNSYRPIPEVEKLLNLTNLINLGNDEDIINTLSGYVSKSGGSVLAIGGGNNVNYAQLSKITGVGNEIKGTENNISRFDMIDGHNNIINEGSYNAIIGTNYEVKKSGRNILYGFNKEKNIIKNSNIVSIGNDIEVTEDNSVYLGNNSKSSVNKNSTIWISNDEIRNKSKELNDLENKYKQLEADYEKELSEEFIKQTKQSRDKTPEKAKEDLENAREEIKKRYNEYKEKNKEEYEGKLKELKEEYKKLYSEKYSEYKDYAGINNIGGIVTVGNDTLTRVIQNVAPGLISRDSTDAINGSQLYKFANQYITIKDGKGGETKVKLGDTLTLKGTTVDVTVEGPKSEQTNNTSAQTNTTSQPESSTPAEPKVQEHTATFEVKGKFEYVLREGDTEKVLTEDKDGKLKDGNTSYEKSDKKIILRVKDGEKVITNVANGIKAKDAVNVSQLNDVKSKLQNDIKEVDKKSDLALGGVSNAVAMANLPQVMGNKKFNLAASYGYYGGSHAIAVGFSGTNDKQNFIYKLSGSVNNKGDLAFGIGAGVMLGEVNNKDKKIEDLTKENKEIKENLRNQSAEIQELKEIVRRLMKK
ncbi:YadA-like family protein [Sneathia vaginalis]|uniref:YadA-like family protein n=1 Tax=Sneathia vaginalis TaxID=187101 RepID=UPI00288B1CAC|nr:YadA-like family protein [Sneathia vaginalis]